MRKIENQGHRTILYTVLKLLLVMMLSTFLFVCSSGTTPSDCTDCGNGLIDGYLYKKVTFNDLAGLTQINVSANLDQCIRFKMDGEDFADATIIDDCCCTIYN